MDGTTSITVRISFEVRDRHAEAAAARGYTLARHLADVLERVDPDELPVAPGEDEITQLRRRQLAAIEAAGCADESIRAMLEPAKLPTVLAEALAQSKRGGPGMKHYGTVLGGRLRLLLPDAADELDEIAETPFTSNGPSNLLVARLGDLLRERLPIVLDSVDRHHHDVVLCTALAYLPRAPERDAPRLEAVR